MTKKEKRWLFIIFLLFLLMAFYKDATNKVVTKEGTIAREEVGGKAQEIVLTLDAEGVLEDYSYELKIDPQKLTETEAIALFEEAKKVIEEEFSEVEETLPSKKKYCNGLVKAKWKFGEREYINAQGEIQQDQIPSEGVVCTAEVSLSCGSYEQIYQFPFYVSKKEKTRQEEFLENLESYMEQQMLLEGETQLELPKELDGISVEWSEEKSSYTLQVLILEIVALIFLLWAKRKEAAQKEHRRVQALQLEYPELVNQLAMLVETGMPLRQTWNKIAMQYERKREHHWIERKEVFEAILRMNRRLNEGETERMAYESFAEEINVRCYHQLIRMLISHANKGSVGLSAFLEEECRRAYEEQIIHAKKAGEEASTRMLLPLMLMMVLVMGIVLLPAIIQLLK